MNIIKSSFTLLQVVILLLLMSCSPSDDSKDKGVVEKTQDKIAQDAVAHIKDPLDQAKAVNKIANERVQQIEEAQKAE